MLMRAAVGAGVKLPPQALQALTAGSGNPLKTSMERVGFTVDTRSAPLDFLVIDAMARTPTANEGDARGKVIGQLSREVLDGPDLPISTPISACPARARLEPASRTPASSGFVLFDLFAVFVVCVACED